MDEKRKAELRAKKAVVAWTCATGNGLAHLFYLKSLGNHKYCLVREPLLDEKELKVTPIWVAESEEKMELLIMSITNTLKMRTVALKKHYLLGIKEAVEEGEKVPALEGK